MDAFEAEVALTDMHLAKACLLVARDAHPDLDVDLALDAFVPLAERVQEAAREAPFPDAVRRVLAEEEAFMGTTGDYYAPENSLLDSVLETRQGIPITLCVVYLEVARRLGEPLVAVGLPGHFLVRHEETLLDPFHGGRRVDERDCQAMLDRLSGGTMPLTPDMLRAVSDRDVLARVLRNLKGAYARRGDVDRALRVCNRLLVLSPFAFEEYRDRGVLRRAAGDAEGARQDLDRYLRGLPRAPDAAAVRRMRDELPR